MACRSCSGTGQFECDNCNGRGTIGSGDDEEKCNGCNGRGTIVCRNCNGSGLDDDDRLLKTAPSSPKP